jgi:hypothetical protein
MSSLSFLIWSVTELRRCYYEQSSYNKVIPPLTVLRLDQIQFGRLPYAHGRCGQPGSLVGGGTPSHSVGGRRAAWEPLRGHILRGRQGGYGTPAINAVRRIPFEGEHLEATRAGQQRMAERESLC